MSAAAGGALGEAHRVAGDVAEAMGLLSRSNSNSIDSEGGRRRSLRKREGKSYAEFGDADFIIEDDNSTPGSPIKGAHHPRHSNAHKMNSDNNHSISNGDVDMESASEDDEGPLDPLPLPKELPLDVLEERKALIRQLQTQLRNEEMSLVLLKKIRQSQVLAEQAKEAKVSIQPASVSRSSQNQHRGTPPLARTPGQAKTGSISNSSGIKSGVKSVLTPDLSHLKPVSVDPKSLPSGLPANLVSLMSKGALGATKLTEVSKTSKMETETPAQKQAAAKLALRKQLEKTLLQIPPPKPPPPEMHFIPNPTNTEFICLLGLEECVSKILNEDKENTIQPHPFSCSQCGTDFTPTWKWDKGKDNGKEVKVICEQCVTTNVKKALKAEHTNRLKAAFVKALQQEQELEAHMAAQASQTASSSSSSARIASPDPRARNSVDVTVRPASGSSASSRSIPSAHQTTRTASTTSAATVERAPYRSSATTSASISRGSAIGGSSSSAGRSTSSNNLSSLSRSSYNNGGLTNSASSRSNTTSTSKADSMANANAMAAQLAALMGMGAYGSTTDPAAATSMALLQAAAQNQMLMGAGYSGGSASSGSSTSAGRSGSSGGSGSTSNHTSSGGGRSGSSSSSSNDLNAQLAAMNQLMNPLMYNYQAMAAMAQAMSMTGSSTSSSSKSGSGGSGGAGSSSSTSATNQMMEIQKQAAEHLQRQYMLDMLNPGSLGQSWGSKK